MAAHDSHLSDRGPIHHRMRNLHVMLALLLAWAAALGGPAAAYADQAFTSDGPVEGMWVGSDLACQVSYQAGNTFEFYPPSVAPGDCGVALLLDGTMYAPDFSAHEVTATDNLGYHETFTPVSESTSGDGSASNPYTITTTADAGGIVDVTQTVSYVTGRASLKVSIALRNQTGQPHQARLYFAGDCYASGSDIGYGFRRPEIRSIGCSQNPDNTPQARTIQLLPATAGSHGVEDRYGSVWERIGSQEELADTCLCSTSVDNGVALAWNLTLGSVRTNTYALDVAFTESTPPAAQTDSDGDALPDAWETGSDPAGDAENLSTLGADPNRPDIFVHADWMEGCQPPSGWETRAIDLFAQHGIALHVDSGPQSLNADKRPWGARSRAGAVPAQDVLDMSNWATVDGLKDDHFVGSRRRRAFHYMVFAKKLNVPGSNPAIQYQSLSRGVPDSDLVIGNCGRQPRADTVTFIHELGHNLGLRHGGFEDKNFKPNYYSVMNYAYLYWAWKDDSRFVGYSDQLRPNVDELHLDEHAGLQRPLIFYCGSDAHTDMRSGVATDLDLNCNSRFGERSVKANLDRSGDERGASTYETDVGFNDWTAVKYTGGGVMGAATLPARQDAPPVGELTESERTTQDAAEQLANARLARTMIITTRTRSVRYSRKRSRAIRVTITDGLGRTLSGVSVGVRGARLAGRRTIRRTDSRGHADLKLKVRSTKQVQITARKGRYPSPRSFAPASLYIPVYRR